MDALSFIVFEGSAYERGRKMCEKLKDEIPKHLFEIPIQAAVGGKIIARETVRAMRKDVLAKCYGGDISQEEASREAEGKARSVCARSERGDSAEGVYERSEAGRGVN